jgi:hypothetical protein
MTKQQKLRAVLRFVITVWTRRWIVLAELENAWEQHLFLEEVRRLSTVDRMLPAYRQDNLEVVLEKRG